MPYCHHCQADHGAEHVLMPDQAVRFVCKETKIGTEPQTNKPLPYVAQSEDYIPVCVKCRRPMWEAMVGRHDLLYCEPRSARDQCPDWGARDYAKCLTAIKKEDPKITEHYQIATLQDIQALHKEDKRLLERAVKKRADLLAAIKKNPKAKIVEASEGADMTIAPGKYTLVHVNHGAMTSRDEVTVKEVKDDRIFFARRGKRKQFSHDMSDTTILLPGWDQPIRVDSDGNKFQGNALLNLTDRTRSGNNTPGDLKMVLAGNLNPKLDKGRILMWTAKRIEADEPLVLYPELAKELCNGGGHAIMDKYLNPDEPEAPPPPEPKVTFKKAKIIPTRQGVKAVPIPDPIDKPVSEGSNPVDKAEPPTQGAELQKHKHLKKGHTYWLVVPKERVSRAAWLATASRAKAAGGGYSRAYKPAGTPGGYAFKDEAKARKFMADEFGTKAPAIETPKPAPKPEQKEPPAQLPPLYVDNMNVIHRESETELFGEGAIKTKQHGEAVVGRLLALKVDWTLPISKILDAHEDLDEQASRALQEPEKKPEKEEEPAAEPEKKWECGIKGVGETKLTFNGMRFATKAEAEKHGEDLFMRWTGMDGYEAVFDRQEEPAVEEPAANVVVADFTPPADDLDENGDDAETRAAMEMANSL